GPSASDSGTALERPALLRSVAPGQAADEFGAGKKKQRAFAHARHATNDVAGKPKGRRSAMFASPAQFAKFPQIDSNRNSHTARELSSCRFLNTSARNVSTSLKPWSSVATRPSVPSAKARS